MIKESADSFGRLEYPTPGDRDRLERVVGDNFALIELASQRSLVGMFAKLNTLPPKLVAYFCHEVAAEVASPFIAQSVRVDQSACIAIISRYGAGARTRAVARRSDLTDRIVEQLRALQDPAVDRALELRQTANIAGTGPSPDQPAEPLPWASLKALAHHAADGEKALFATGLADATGLSMESAMALCDDPGSRNMLFALRFLGFDTELGLVVFTGLCGAWADDKNVRQRFRDQYGAISAIEATDRVQTWKHDERAAAARLLERIANDPAPADARRRSA